MAAALEEIKPYVLVAGAVALLGTPADVAVPIVRRLRRRSGVQVGPNVMNLINGTVALGVTHYVRQHPAQWQRWQHRPLTRWAWTASLVYLAVSPAATAGWKRGVVFRGRSPLWGGLPSPIGLIQFALVLVALYRAQRGAVLQGNRASAPTF
jgi:hypothetical protein